MTIEEKPKSKAKRTRNRGAEYERRKIKRLIKQPKNPEEEGFSDAASDLINAQLVLLEQRAKDLPTDADRDIDFAYRHMESPTVTPLMAPTTAAWSWYIYSRTERNKFLEICAKREDAKSKLAGTITSQRMEDDKRQQFTILDRIEKQLTLDIKGVVTDLMSKFPEDTLLECRKHAPAWKAFHEKYP